MRLSKQDTTYLKGIAIILIMFHNYLHLLPSTPGENEFYFSQYRFFIVIRNILNEPLDIFGQLFSYFGHYGVQIFIFLSGYGLTLSLKNSSNLFKYSFDKILKIYKLLIVSIFLLTIYYIVRGFPIDSFFIKSNLLKLLLISNLSENTVFNPVGPWWFFGAIIQLYIIFPFFAKIDKKYIFYLIALTIFSVEFFVMIFYRDYHPLLRFNFWGHVPTFILGIYFAKYSSKIDFKLFILALGVFIIGFFNRFFWVLSFSSIPIVSIYLYSKISPKQTTLFNKSVIYIGEISMYAFVLNGFIREFFLKSGGKSPSYGILFSLINFAVVIALSTIITLISKYIKLAFRVLKQKLITK
ncbi:acyltransferase [bacterium]|nr:acyltransferase [bacterium]